MYSISTVRGNGRGDRIIDQFHSANTGSPRKHYQEYTKLVTTPPICTEVMWLLSPDWHTQNEFLLDVAKGLYECEQLLTQDFSRIAELNAQYSDLPGNFADLCLIAISECLDIAAIALDSDFDVYRRYRKQPFERVLWSE